MPQRLLVYIQTVTADSFSYVLLDEQNNVVQPPVSATLEQLSALAQERTLILLIASELLILLQAKLPATTRERIQKALPFAVEEQLAMPLDACHFALGERFDSLQTAVVIEQALLATLLTRFSDAGMNVRQVIPDVLLVAGSRDDWHCVIDNERALANFGQQNGVAIEANQLQLLLGSKINESEYLPRQISINLIGQSQFTLSGEVDVINGIPVKLQQQQEPLLTYLAKQLKTANPINLLQGNFQTAQDNSRLKTIWRIPAMLSIILIALFLISQIGQFIYLQQKQKQLTARINTIYRQLFPAATSITSPKLRIEREYKQLTGGNGANFLPLLASVGDLLRQDKTITLNAIKFNQGHLTLAVQAANFQTLQQFTAKLQRQHLRVNQHNAKTSGEAVQADIEVSQ